MRRGRRVSLMASRSSLVGFPSRGGKVCVCVNLASSKRGLLGYPSLSRLTSCPPPSRLLLTRIKDYLKGTQTLTPLIATHQNPPSTRRVWPMRLTSRLSAKDQVACLQPGMRFSAHPQCASGAPDLLFVPDPSASATQSSSVAPTTTVLASTLFAICPPCTPPE